MIAQIVGGAVAFSERIQSADPLLLLHIGQFAAAIVLLFSSQAAENCSDRMQLLKPAISLTQPFINYTSCKTGHVGEIDLNIQLPA